MARCNKCGYQITEDMRFCAFCGSKVKVKIDKQRPPFLEEHKPSIFKVISAICTISGIFGVLIYLCYLAVIHQRTRPSQHVTDFDDYMIYFLGASIIVTIVGLIGLSLRER